MRNLHKSSFLWTGLLIVAMGTMAFHSSNLFTITRNIDLYSEMYRVLNESYVDEVEAAQLMRTGVDAMLKNLDPYTNYITEAQIEGYKLDRFAAGGDIGVEVQAQKGEIFVSKVMEGLSAEESGIKPGDRLLSIDGKDTKGRTAAEVTLFLTGQPQTHVEVEVESFSSKEKQVLVLERQAVKPKNVTFSKMLNDTVGYVRLSRFEANCGAYVKTAIMNLQEENEGMEYLVFDLRGNPGGLLNEAIMVSNIFVDKGELVCSTKGKTADWDKDYKAPVDPLSTDLPLAVLINGSSASASEIVSGVVQDLDRGVVIGERSYGKGLVQQTRDIGFNSKLKLTVAKYYIPSGRCIQAVDYYGEYTDAGAKTIPDSLKNEFRTRNGRLVYDNSGVAPDLEISSETENFLVDGLLKNRAIFDFASIYQSKRDSIEAPIEFAIDDQDFEDFLAFVEAGDYHVASKTEQVIKRLEASVERESYSASVKEQIEGLKTRMSNLQKDDLQAAKAEIMRLIRLEIIERFHYENGRIEASLNQDPYILTALDVFSDPSRMREILGSTK